MPRKLPVPTYEPVPRKVGWTVFVYYLDLDDDLHEWLRVKEVYAENEMQAQLVAADIKTKGITISEGKSFRMIPPHRLQLIMGQDTRG